MFVCPNCKGCLVEHPERYDCFYCTRSYPVICGIPDFRLMPDPYIGFEADREKGRMLAKAGEGRSFEELLRYYYSVTPEDPADLAEHWIARSLAEVQIAGVTVAAYLRRGGGLLDLGCSTGAMLAAAARQFESVVGVDVAFRWLVVGAVRLRELGVKPNLVCANAEHLPFPDESFDAISAIDLLEHLLEPSLAVQEAFRVSRREARSVFRINNRFAPLPEPHVRIWGVGLIPRKCQARYVAWLRKDLHPYGIELRSVHELNKLCRDAGFEIVTIEPAELHAPQLRNRLIQRAIAIYNKARKWPLSGALLKLAGPLLVCVGARVSAKAERPT